jgi:hypothetical protein
MHLNCKAFLCRSYQIVLINSLWATAERERENGKGIKWEEEEWRSLFLRAIPLSQIYIFQLNFQEE